MFHSLIHFWLGLRQRMKPQRCRVSTPCWKAPRQRWCHTFTHLASIEKQHLALPIQLNDAFKCSLSYLWAVWCWYHWTMLSTCFCVCGSPGPCRCRSPAPSPSRWRSIAGTALPLFPPADGTLAWGSGGCSFRKASSSLCPSSLSETGWAREQREDEETGMGRREEVWE